MNPGGLQITAGAVTAAGSADMFTDNSGTGTNGNHVAVVNSAGTMLTISTGTKSAGDVERRRQHDCFAGRDAFGGFGSARRINGQRKPERSRP